MLRKNLICSGNENLTLEEAFKKFKEFVKEYEINQIKKLNSFVMEEGYVVLRKVKNKNQRIIPLSRSLINILQEYLKYREGVEKTSTHLFRHIFAKKWILNGGDSFRLKKILGYKSMEMVEEYVNMFSK